MNRLVLFILFLLSSIQQPLKACGYEPWGEDIRFSLIPHNMFLYSNGYEAFYYCADHNSNDYYIPGEFVDSISDDVRINLRLWKKYCNNIPTEHDIYVAVYKGESKSRSNSFVKYLHDHHDHEALEYLAFALRCSGLNTELSDPWERHDDAVSKARNDFLKFAQQKAYSVLNADIRKRYAFQAIRIAFYNEDTLSIPKIYSQYFQHTKNKDLIDYWAMYFEARNSKDTVYSNYLLAQVFQQSPEKRFVCTEYYYRSIPIAKVLGLCKNNTERAAVYLIASIRNPGRALESIKQAYKIDPTSETLSFLIQREISKLQDWIYTPYYTAYDPSVYPNHESWRATRISIDRTYAAEVLKFVQSVNMAKVRKPEVWHTAQAYLYLMSGNCSAGVTYVNKVKNKDCFNNEQKTLLLSIGALCQIGQQSFGTAVLPSSLQNFIFTEGNKKNHAFLFALGRELEYKGNTTDAAILYSKITHIEWGDGVYWRGKSAYNCSLHEIYTDYFDYIDGNYSISEVTALIQRVKAKHQNNKFNNWYYNNITSEVPHLYDLLGTLYLRQNDLHHALAYYEMVEDSIWESELYKFYLDEDPFYIFTPVDSNTFTKESVVRTLITYLNYANNPNNKDRDYYYYLVANCYLNMTRWGNSKIMRHYAWTYNNTRENRYQRRTDDEEFYTCRLALQYYLKAKSVSKSKTFAAVCLRMAGRCEKYKLMYNGKVEYYVEDYQTRLLSMNRYYKQLQNEYPDLYEDLISNCVSMEGFLDERRSKVKKMAMKIPS